MVYCKKGWSYVINTLRPRQNGHHFPDEIFKCIFLNENARISNKISLKCVPDGPINNIPALVQIMAWRRQGDKPLSETMMVRLPTHICVTLPQWVNQWQPSLLMHICITPWCVNTSPPIDAYVRQRAGSALLITHLLGTYWTQFNFIMLNYKKMSVCHATCQPQSITWTNNDLSSVRSIDIIWE